MKLEISNGAFQYEKGIDVIKNISFSLNDNEVLSILGPNGAGKSTLLICLAGFQRLSSGDVFLDGKNINKMTETEISKIIAYVPQNHNPTFDYTVKEFVLLGRAPHIGLMASPGKEDIEIALQAIRDVGIEHLVSKPYTQISGGERQLVLIARALCQQPKILLMDEPTSHLDYGNQVIMMKRIEHLRDMGYAIVMTSHFPDQVLMCSDKVAVVNNHTIVTFGTPSEVMTEENLSATYRIPISLINCDLQKRKVCIPDFDNLILE